MKRNYITVLCVHIIFSLLFLAGCTSTSQLEKAIKENNDRVEFLNSSYSENMSEAEEMEREILEAVIKGHIDLSKPEKLALSVSEEYINSYIMVINNRLSYDLEIQGVEDVKAIVRQVVENGSRVYYFFNDSNGSVEQLFVFESLGGGLYKLSFSWLGGLCYEVESSIDL